MFDLFTQPLIESGESLKQAGMQRAMDSANEVHENWGERAFELLREYCSMKIEFMSEDFRAFCFNKNLPTPPSLRAFGSVMMKGAKSGLIKRVGIRSVSNPKAHKANASVWQTIK